MEVEKTVHPNFRSKAMTFTVDEPNYEAPGIVAPVNQMRGNFMGEPRTPMLLANAGIAAGNLADTGVGFNAMVSNTVRIVADEERDYIKNCRNPRLVLLDGCYYRLIEHVVGDIPRNLTKLFDGHVQDIELRSVNGKIYGRLLFKPYGNGGQVTYGRYYPLDTLQSPRSTEALLKEGLALCTNGATLRTMISELNDLLMKMLMKKLSCVTECHLGFCVGGGVCTYAESVPDVSGGEDWSFGKIRRIRADVNGDIGGLALQTISAYEQIGRSSGAVVFLFSYVALLYSLLGLERGEIALVLLGDIYQTRRVATHYMKAYRRDGEDYISVNDRVKATEAYLGIIRDDTVVISVNPDSPYRREQVRQYFTAARTGTYKKARLHSLFALCMEDAGLATYENQVVVEVDGLPDKAFSDSTPQLFRNFVIAEIEAAASYFTERIPMVMKKRMGQNDGISAFIAAVKTVPDVLSEMLERHSVETKVVDVFCKFCDSGIAEIMTQLEDNGRADLIAVFRHAVIHEVAEGTYQAQKRLRPLQGVINATIFYDQAYYYLPQETFTAICRSHRISGHSERKLLVQLAEASFLVREASGKREFGQYIYYIRKDGKPCRINGYFIQRYFWGESVGAIPLEALTDKSYGKEVETVRKPAT